VPDDHLDVGVVHRGYQCGVVIDNGVFCRLFGHQLCDRYIYHGVDWRAGGVVHLVIAQFVEWRGQCARPRQSWVINACDIPPDVFIKRRQGVAYLCRN
jgi:hypothetical protein